MVAVDGLLAAMASKSVSLRLKLRKDGRRANPGHSDNRKVWVRN